MREIKFRAWDGKEMWPVRGFFNNDPSLDLSNHSVMTSWGDQANSWSGKGRPLMQFTGLLDKNGKEIYEGDVIKETSNLSPVAEVTFKDTSFFAGNPYLDDDDYWWEVIGNVHETPELLKGEL